MPNTDTTEPVIEAKLGISLAWSSLDSHHLQEAFELPGLDDAGLPAEALSDAAMKKLRLRHPNLALHAGRIIDQSVSQNILSAPKGMREAFAKQVAKQLESAARRGFASASLDLGLETAMNDKEPRDRAITIIRSLAPTLLRCKIHAALPCRAPSLAGDNYPAALADFIKDCMTTGLKAALEVHPHDLHPGFNPVPLIRGLEFDIATATLMFGVDTGNRLVKAHIEPWATLLKRYGFKGPILLCPKSGDRTRLPAECVALASLINACKSGSAERPSQPKLI